MTPQEHEQRPEVAIDWFLAVREHGIEAANEIEDLRLARESRLGREVTFAEAQMVWAMAHA
jgi:hypothetical protein